MKPKSVNLGTSLGLLKYKHFALGTGSKQIKWVDIIGITVSNVRRIISLAPKINMFSKNYAKRDATRAYVGKIKE